MDHAALKDHFDYGREILERGDGYGAVRGYLRRQKLDAEVETRILEALQKAEEEGVIQIPDGIPGKAESNDRPSPWVAYGMIAFGTLMVPLLWRLGFVAVLPFSLIVMGFYQLRHGDFKRSR